MAINQIHPGTSPLEGIANALRVVESVYGIKGAAAKADMIDRQLAQAKAESDPNSQESKLATGERGALYDYALKKGLISSSQASALKSALMGSPETKAEDGTIIAAKPGMSAASLSQDHGEGPLSKALAGLQSAEASRARMEAIAGTKQDANQMRANQAYDQVIGKNYESRLDAANRVKGIIDAARSGTLVPSENLGTSLANDINMLQANKVTVSGSEHARPNTLFGKGGQLAHFISGDPQAAITQADLAQMAKETDLLYNEIGKQHQAKFSSWVKGQPPSVQPALMERYADSRQQYFPQGASVSSADTGPVAQAKGGGVPGVSNANAGEGTGPHGNVVYQNGHSYQWNPQTKKYE